MTLAITRGPGLSQCAAVIALFLCAQAAACAQTSPARPSEANESAAMTPNTARIESDTLVLDVRFDARVGAPVQVQYRLENISPAPLAVFDRGDRHAVLTGRHATGDIGMPATRDEGSGDVTLSHLARPLPSPSPTLPPVPLAAKVAPGGVLEGAFTASPMTLDAPKRLRWCLGVSAFDPAHFSSPERARDVEIWHASFDESGRQHVVCTPWFDLAAGAFER